jgi:hypothetical protein
MTTKQVRWVLRSYPVPLAIVVPGKGVKGSQLHPASTHLIFSFVKEPTNICPCLK